MTALVESSAQVAPHDERRLDNPVFAALTGAQAQFAVSSGRAVRYRPAVAPFFAVPDDARAADWEDAVRLFGRGSTAMLVHAGLTPPAPWQVVQESAAVQMVGERVSGCADPEAVPLGPADVDEVLELVRETKPGPFLKETVELGRFLGIRRDGRLVAMAGERFRFDGWREISAVCTRASHRGQGLASRLMGAIIDGIERDSETPFLHALVTNSNAIRLYEQLGFRIRRQLVVSTLAADGRRRG